jgi:hypothetical protein
MYICYTITMNFWRNEGPPLTFAQAIEAGEKDALDRVKKRFEQAENEVDNLAYHNTQHTGNVIRRTKAILGAIRDADRTALSEQLIKLGGFIAAWHDTVQKYEINEVTDGAFTKEIRRRFIGGNEKESADEAIDYMRSLNHSPFSDEDEEFVHQGIHVTIPGPDLKQGTMIQPYLTGESNLVTRAVALADLGTAGMDGPQEFILGGNAFFREENIDIHKALQHPESLSAAQKEFFRKRMITWSEGQEKFATGRKELLNTELDGLSEEEQLAVRNLFNTFDESIQGAQAKTERRKEMSFEELVSDFGYFS